jgi:hypothetical protein
MSSLTEVPNSLVNCRCPAFLCESLVQLGDLVPEELRAAK